MPGVRELAAQGIVTGASARNWQSYGDSVHLPAGCDEATRALLTDPQTSGGLLVACAPEAAEQVLRLFTQAGFAQASVIGRMAALPPGQAPVCVQ